MIERGREGGREQTEIVKTQGRRKSVAKNWKESKLKDNNRQEGRQQ